MVQFIKSSEKPLLRPLVQSLQIQLIDVHLCTCKGSAFLVSPTTKAAGSEALLKAVSCKVRSRYITRETSVGYEK